jgi:hypothetical protein
MTERAEPHTFVLYVENRPGVLNRISSLFRRRGYNIESLTVGHTERPGDFAHDDRFGDRSRARPIAWKPISTSW